MDMIWPGAGADMVRLIAEPGAILLAFALALLIRAKSHALLVIADLWLFLELLATVMHPDYRFGDLLMPRLLATAVQVCVALGLIWVWRRWRATASSVAAH